MPLIQITDLENTHRPLMGIDPGTKTFGLSISDRNQVVSTAVRTIKRGKFSADAQTLFNFYDERSCVAFVIGNPVNMDGTAGQRAQSVRALARNLLKIRDIPILLWDERMSTQAVERELITKLDMSRAKRSEVIDAHAAQYILQGALDALNHIRD